MYGALLISVITRNILIYITINYKLTALLNDFLYITKKLTPTFCPVSGKNYIVVSTSNNTLKFECLKINVFGYS